LQAAGIAAELKPARHRNKVLRLHAHRVHAPAGQRQAELPIAFRGCGGACAAGGNERGVRPRQLPSRRIENRAGDARRPVCAASAKR
jgi:hypothetical protein